MQTIHPPIQSTATSYGLLLALRRHPLVDTVAFFINSGDLKGSGRIVFRSDQAGTTSIELLFGGNPLIPLAQRFSARR